MFKVMPQLGCCPNHSLEDAEENCQRSRRMASSGMLRHVALVRTDVSDELSASEMSALTRATRHNIPEHNSS
jgi:hypothetical protein